MNQTPQSREKENFPTKEYTYSHNHHIHQATNDHYVNKNTLQLHTSYRNIKEFETKTNQPYIPPQNRKHIYVYSCES